MNKSSTNNNRVRTLGVNTDKGQLYNLRVLVSKGKFKVQRVEKRVKINQYVSKWEPVEAREFARGLHRGELVT